MHDELFSSWLVRSALANGCDPLAFADAIWPKSRVWTMDTDRGIPAGRLRALARSSGVPARTFEGSTLQEVASLVVNGSLPKKNFWHWILTVGARNRKRSGGLQYCPVCLATDRRPYFRKHWRYAWHTVCEAHGNILLLDRCQGCGAAVQPHRLTADMKSIAVCPICCTDLRDGKTTVGERHAILFQQASDTVLSGHRQLLHDREVTIREWFTAAGFYWNLVRRIMDGRTESLNAFGRSVGLQYLNLRPGVPAIEQARTSDRHDMLGGVFPIMEISRLEMKAHLGAAAVTLQAFCPGRVQLPGALTEVAAGLKDLPITRTRKAKKGPVDIMAPKPRKTVERMMRRLVDRGLAKL